MTIATRKSIVVSTFNRHEHLENCLNSIVNASGFEDYNLILLFQKGSDEVWNVINRYIHHIDYLCIIDGSMKTSLHNINWNRFATYNVAFNLFNADFVLGVEDDTIISNDALIFCNEVFEKYKKKRNFKGINLGSFEFSNQAQTNTYSRLRYGLHGQAGVITKSVWRSFSSGGIPENIDVEPLDSMLEYRLKTGFMVTSNRGRYLDRGWGGTHAPRSQYDSSFINLQNSWVGSDSKVREFAESPVSHSWRKDAILFRHRDSLIAYLRLMKYSFKNSRVMRKS